MRSVQIANRPLRRVNLNHMDKELCNILAEMRSSTTTASPHGEIATCDFHLEGSDLKGNYVYQVYLPPQIRTGEELPLIIFLHGIRERGTGGYISSMFAAVAMQYLKGIPAVVLFPQCRPGKYWWDEDMERMVIAQRQELIVELGIDMKRQYLVGVSMGGYGVWWMALRNPKKFAALVSICGGSPFTNGDRFTNLAERIGQTPAWLFHGAQDKVVPVSESRRMAAAIRANQGRVKYSEYENVGHNVWLNALGEKELIPWLFAQKL
jgi:predicted peptidase